MYELTEKCYPYGDEPKYESVEAEYVQPDLLGDDGVIEIPELYDLLAGLLDWNPESRLIGEELMGHAYWRSRSGEPADWEIVENRRLPSPLLAVAQERMEFRAAMEREAEEGGSGSFVRRRMSITASAVATELSEAAANQAKVDQISDADLLGKSRSQESANLLELENQMRVEDWEFSSHHAIANEYIESHQDVVSVM